MGSIATYKNELCTVVLLIANYSVRYTEHVPVGTTLICSPFHGYCLAKKILMKSREIIIIFTVFRWSFRLWQEIWWAAMLNSDDSHVRIVFLCRMEIPLRSCTIKYHRRNESRYIMSVVNQVVKFGGIISLLPVGHCIISHCNWSRNVNSCFEGECNSGGFNN